MSRLLRYSHPGAYHHVTVRNNNREFRPTHDALFARLRDILADARWTRRFRLLDYCFMTNHFHLLLPVPHEDKLSRAVHGVANRSSRWFNARVGRNDKRFA